MSYVRSYMEPLSNDNISQKFTSLLLENLRTQQLHQYLKANMSRTVWCRLCVNSCSDYKNLYDENGVRNDDLYEMTAKYFHPIFLSMAKGGQLSVLCLECWHKISEFHHFQSQIISAQAELLDKQVEVVDVNTKIAASFEASVVPINAAAMTNHENDINDKCVFVSLPDWEMHDGNDESLMAESKYTILKNVIVTSAGDKEVSTEEISSQNYENQSDQMANEHTDDAAEDNDNYMEFSQSDLALIDSMEFKPGSLISLSQTANKTNGPETRASKVKRLDDIMAQWGQTLNCPLCPEPITSYSALREHFEKKHRHIDSHIICCQRKLKTRYHIEEHLRLHLDPSGYKCDMCGTSFTAKGALKRHMHQQHLRPKVAKQSKSKKKQYAKSVKDLDAIIARWKPNLQCVLCTAAHPNFEVLRRHFHLEHPLERCHIICCQQKLETRWRIVEHARFHMDPKSFKCKYCDKRQMSRDQLRDHMHEKHSIIVKGQGHKCGICDKVFRFAKNRQEHMNVHREKEMAMSSHKYTEPRQKRECEELIGKVCPQSDLASLVNDIGDDNDPHIKRLLRKETRERNIKRLDDLIAEWGQTLECPECKETLINYSLLREHFANNHAGNPSYLVCCQRKLCNRIHIEEHIRLHIDPNTYSCDMCDTSFSARSSYRRHILRKHASNSKAISKPGKRTRQTNSPAKELNLQCVLCSASHTNFELLRRHFQLEHPQEQSYISCCQQKLETRRQIVEHARWHMNPKSFKCSFCKARHASGKQLVDHIHEHHPLKLEAANDKHKCNICDSKVFKTWEDLQAHMVCHAGAQLYKCLHCPETMKYRYNLYPHLRNVHPQAWCDKKNVQKHFALIEIHKDGSFVADGTEGLDI